MMYGKTTEAAIAVMTRLAEVHDGKGKRLSVAELSASRRLPRPFVAKVLSSLAGAGFIVSVRGPGGGFSLARAPREITLFQVISLFERDRSGNCPVGGGICGQGEKCPIHDRLAGIRRATDALLRDTTFEAFQRVGRRFRPAASVPRTRRRS